MPPPLRVPLDPAAQAELEHRYLTTRDAETRTRYQIVLLNAQGHTHPRSPRWSGAAPTPSAGSSGATWPAVPTRCRTGPIRVSRPTTRPPGRPSWSGSPSWTPTRSAWTVEGVGLTTAAAVVSLLLAGLLLTVAGRQVLVAVVLFALVFVALDLRESVHQASEARGGLLAIARLTALAHLGVAGLAGVRLRQPRHTGVAP